jgi:hypothetical protein
VTAQRLDDLWIADRVRTQQRQVVLDRARRHGGGRPTSSAPAPPIGLADDAHHLVAAGQQGVERGERQLGRAEEGDAEGGRQRVYPSASAASCFLRLLT